MEKQIGHLGLSRTETLLEGIGRYRIQDVLIFSNSVGVRVIAENISDLSYRSSSHT